MITLDQLSIKIFADGADLPTMVELAKNPLIRGFTTNPTLMHKAGVRDYRAFAREAITIAGDRPISLEVFADDLEGMERQAREIASWGSNVYVKVPVTNTQGVSTNDTVTRLSHWGIRVNVTAVTTFAQARAVATCLDPRVPAYISIFAGRIADTGHDPVYTIMTTRTVLDRWRPLIEIIWASPREVLNIYQADAAGAHIITVSADILAKLPNIGKDLTQLSLETVQMFHRDAQAAGFTL